MSHGQHHALHTALSRQTIKLMLHMKRLLQKHGISVSLSQPDAYAQLLNTSQEIDDEAMQQLRVRLLEMRASFELSQAITAPLPHHHTTPHVAAMEPTEPAPTPALLLHDDPSGVDEDALVAAPLKTIAETTKADVFLTCDRCQRLLGMKLRRLRKTQPLPVSCPCGMLFRVELDGRKYTRKSTQLVGAYRCENSGKIGGLVVEDLSFGGMQLAVHMPHSIAINDRLQVSFTLDDVDRTIVHEHVRVQYVHDTTVGVVFTHTAEFNKTLAAFLMQ